MCVNLRANWRGSWSAWNSLVHFGHDKIGNQSPVLILLVSYERHRAAHNLVGTHSICSGHCEYFEKDITKVDCFCTVGYVVRDFLPLWCSLDHLYRVVLLQHIYQDLQKPQSIRPPTYDTCRENVIMMTLLIPLKASTHTNTTANKENPD